MNASDVTIEDLEAAIAEVEPLGMHATVDLIRRRIQEVCPHPVYVSNARGWPVCGRCGRTQTVLPERA